MTSSSNFASFSPYTPPPDDPSYSSSARPARPWYPGTSAGTSLEVSETSYQSGGIPAFGVSAFESGVATMPREQSPWITRYGMRVDILAAIAYIFGPVSALALLILETHSDYVRFHAYQSALLTTPLVILRIFASLVHSSLWIQVSFSLLVIFPQALMAIRAYRDASQHDLIHFHLPLIGLVAERWLVEE